MMSIYFVYTGDGIEYHDSEADACKSAQDWIDEYRTLQSGMRRSTACAGVKSGSKQGRLLSVRKMSMWIISLRTLRKGTIVQTETDEYWRVKSYLNGTINVEDGRIEPTKYGINGIGPHIGIHYKPAGDGGASPTTDNERYDLAERIAGLLNNEAVERSGFVRIDDNNGSFNGIEFSAIGPHFDLRPPTYWWDQLETDEEKAARKFLMDQIVK